MVLVPTTFYCEEAYTLSHPQIFRQCEDVHIGPLYLYLHGQLYLYRTYLMHGFHLDVKL